MNKRICFVEDGSVDLDELTKLLSPNCEIIVYRQGARAPFFETVSFDEKPLTCTQVQDAAKQTAKNIIVFIENFVSTNAKHKKQPDFNELIAHLNDVFHLEEENQ